MATVEIGHALILVAQQCGEQWAVICPGQVIHFTRGSWLHFEHAEAGWLCVTVHIITPTCPVPPMSHRLTSSLLLKVRRYYIETLQSTMELYQHTSVIKSTVNGYNWTYSIKIRPNDFSNPTWTPWRKGYWHHGDSGPIACHLPPWVCIKALTGTELPTVPRMWVQLHLIAWHSLLELLSLHPSICSQIWSSMTFQPCTSMLWPL